MKVIFSARKRKWFIHNIVSFLHYFCEKLHTVRNRTDGGLWNKIITKHNSQTWKSFQISADSIQSIFDAFSDFVRSDYGNYSKRFFCIVEVSLLCHSVQIRTSFSFRSVLWRTIKPAKGNFRIALVIADGKA